MSRFVSGGTNEEPTERDEAWLKAQAELDAKHVQNLEASKQQDGKSLYETLQANKAAKQDAFEEANRLTNQFQSLNEDEVEFLESVLEAAKAKEKQEKQQTAEQLEAFRRQQEDAEKASKQQDTRVVDVEATDTWSIGPRKRKKGREQVLPGVKLKKASISEDVAAASEDKAMPIPQSSPEPKTEATKDQITTSQPAQKITQSHTTKSSNPPPKLALGLGGYSSDEDD